VPAWGQAASKGGESVMTTVSEMAGNRVNSDDELSEPVGHRVGQIMKRVNQYVSGLKWLNG
jgi:hypothetical protein